MSDRAATQPKADSEPTSPTTRRAVLRTAGVVALAGGGAVVFGACAADGETTTPAASSAQSSSSAPSAAASESASATPSAEASSAEPSASATAKAPSGPSVSTSDVPVGSGVILDDADYVITQPSKGDFKAFSKICTHQSCPVTEISGTNIVCKCHGSMFSIKDGSVTKAPASRPLAESETTVSGGKVYVTT